ncbi:unnamed protein product, partial [Ectocarpus sp. 12 AP-2014]
SNGASVGSGEDENYRVEGTGRSNSSVEGLSGSSPAGKARRGRSQDTGTQHTGIPRSGAGVPDEDAYSPWPGAIAEEEVAGKVVSKEEEDDSDQDSSEEEEEDDDGVEPLPVGDTQEDQPSAAPRDDGGAGPTMVLDKDRAEQESDGGGN